jgi:hypothetical protein
MNIEKIEAIIHYKNMIVYSMRRNPDDQYLQLKMLKDIDEYPMSSFCSYCKIYYWEKHNCGKCPLYVTNPLLFEKCCNGLWMRMQNSRTWEEFTINALRVLEYIITYG